MDLLDIFADGTKKEVRALLNTVLFILTIVYAWRGFDFYRNNSGQIFFDDLREGLDTTLSAVWYQPEHLVDNIAMIAGWSHPAFGICCLVPVLWIISYFFLYQSFDWRK